MEPAINQRSCPTVSLPWSYRALKATLGDSHYLTRHQELLKYSKSSHFAVRCWNLRDKPTIRSNESRGCPHRATWQEFSRTWNIHYVSRAYKPEMTSSSPLYLIQCVMSLASILYANGINQITLVKRAFSANWFPTRVRFVFRCPRPNLSSAATDLSPARQQQGPRG